MFDTVKAHESAHTHRRERARAHTHTQSVGHPNNAVASALRYKTSRLRVLTQLVPVFMVCFPGKAKQTSHSSTYSSLYHSRVFTHQHTHTHTSYVYVIIANGLVK